MIIIATAGELLTNGIRSGLLWIVMFFAAMTGLSKSFVSEEERSTSLFLRVSVPGYAVYFGKLFFNMILALILNFFSVAVFFLFTSGQMPHQPDVFLLSVLLGSLGVAAASTIISAIIAKANTKNAIFPVLSFPLLLPLIYCGIESTRLAFDSVEPATDFLVVMFAYAGAVSAFSFILFEHVWVE
jgi:heme exporter protein B